MTDHANIQWEYPAPRSGFWGEFDRFMGPGITRAELWGGLAFIVVGIVLQILYARTLDWTVLQWIVALVLVADLVGGVWTNATSTAKRWYHRQDQGFRQHLIFIAVHAVQLLLVVLFFRPDDWGFFSIAYGYLLIMAILILRTPLYLQRPVALMALCGAFLINAYILTPTLGLEWFLPVFYLKLLVAHLLREEPYRP